MKERKQHCILRLLTGTLLATAIWGCTHEEPLSSEDNIPVPFTVQVVDAGYVPYDLENGNLSTRIREDGYNTAFTEGDSIGIYVSRERDVVPYKNLCFVLTNVNGTLVWKNPDGYSIWYEGRNSRYYAYYPYQPDPEILPTNKDADIYFRPLIREWQVPYDQSTYEKYTTANLMVSGGVLNHVNRTLIFKFSHMMTLLEIDFSAVSDLSEITFNSFVPYQSDASGKKYRYIVRYDESGLEKDLSVTYKSKGVINDVMFTGIKRLGRGKGKTYYLKDN